MAPFLEGIMTSSFAVASGHAFTSEVAAEVLRAGGTAVDAAIAGAFATFIAEPVLASPLSGGFLMVANSNARPTILDAFVQTPSRKRPIDQIDIQEIEVDFGPANQKFHCGAGTIATPGLIPGLFDAHQRYGKMPISDLIMPTVTAARNGLEVNTFQAEVLQYVAPIFLASENSRNLYADGESVLQAGSTLKNPDMADVLEVLSYEGPRFFQEGEIARGLTSLSGAQVTMEDMCSYRAIWREPLAVKRGGKDIFLNPAPSLGGVQIALALSSLPDKASDVDFATCLAAIADLRMEVDLDHKPHLAEEIMLAPELVKQLKKSLKQNQAATRGTTHISVIDQDGMGASLTLTNGEGCGEILSDTGIMPNNMLGEDDLVPDGINSWKENRRLASMMCPMILREGKDITVLGSGGSNRIRSALSQVALQLLDYSATLETAIAAPRLHVENGPKLNFENTGSEARYVALNQEFEDAIAWPKPNMFFGGVHGASRDAKGNMKAVGDERRSGVGITA